jgi:2-methylcitrate dehydratase PrpD
MVKDGIGWDAMVAISSVLLAREGFTGIEPLFIEAPQEEWLSDLGTRYQMLNLYFKPYAACRWAQAPIEGALKLFREHQLTVSDIAAILRFSKSTVFNSRGIITGAEPRQ